MRSSTWQQAFEVEVAGGQLGLGEISILMPQGGDCHPQPQVGEHHITAVHQVIQRRGAHLIGVLHRCHADFGGQLAPLLVQLIELRHIGLELCVLGIRGTELMHNLGKTAQQFALAAQHLTPQQIEGLDAVGAFIDRRNPRITCQLLHAPFTNVTVAAEDLHAVVGYLKARVGHEGFADGREERQQVFGVLALGGVAAQVRRVEQLRGEIGQCAVALVEGLHGQQHTPHVGVHDDRVGSFVRGFGAGQRAHLQAVVGVFDRALEARLAIA